MVLEGGRLLGSAAATNGTPGLAGWVRAPPDSREGGSRGSSLYAHDAGRWQRASFSPPRTCEAGRALEVPAEDSRDGYRYQFSPLPPKKHKHGLRKWEPQKRSGRGWSQFSRDSGRASETPPIWRHPENPDLTPHRFYSVLGQFRQTHDDVREGLQIYAEEGVSDLPPTALPQIVPKLNLSRLPRSKGMPFQDDGQTSSDEGSRGQTSSRAENGEEKADRMQKRRKEQGRRKMAARKVEHYGQEWRLTHGSPLASKRQGRRTPCPHPTSAAASDFMRENGRARQDDGGGDMFNMLSPARHGKRALVATDAEVMGLEHRKLGIKPFGTDWDLRGQLKAGDKTLAVTQVAAAIMANPNLENLDIRGNELDGTCGSILAAVLAKHARIQTLSGLSLCEIKENRCKYMIHRPDPNTRESIGPAEMAVLGTLLIETDSLVKLDLQGIAIGTEGFYALGFALRMQSDLTHLNLSRTGMDTAYFNDIAPGLSKCSQLTELHLGTNFLDAEAMTLLANVMTKNLGNLRVVGLRNNLMGPKGSDALEAVCLHDQITDLDLSNNRIGSQGCIKFVQLLKDTHNRLLKDTHNRTGRTGLPDSLVTLNLSFNGLDMAGAWALTEAFSCMHNLRTLKLHCEIPVAALCSKRELSLTGMGFGDIEGVIAAFLLRQNVKLRALDLRGNELGPISYRCLGTVLIGLGALRELNQHSFNSYDMTPQDVEMILRAGMQVSYRAKTPAKPSHRHTFDQVVSQTSFKMPTDAVSADEGVSHEGVDHDNYQTVFENWKASGAGTRPAARVDRAEIENELAASNIEDNDSNDSDSKNQDVVNENHGRPLDFGYYRRNARLRQKAHPRIEKKTHGSESQMASTVIKPVERSAPAAQENDSADIVESGAESSDDRRSPRTTRTKISSKNSSKNSFKKLKNSSKKLKLSIDVLSESPSTSPTFPLRERSVLSASSSLSSPLSARLQISSRNVLAMVATNGLRPGDVRRKRWGASINGNINPMGLLGRAASAHLLSANRNCHHSGSQLGPAGARKLAAELSAAPPRVASVDLSLCNLIGLDEHAHGVLDLGGFSALCNALLRNKRITSLNLGWNRMGADAMPFLKPVLEANPSLTVLDLYKNDIEDDGMRILAPCLDYLHLLQELNLRYNRIGSGGAAILAENLQYMSHLTTLDVAGNAIDAEGLKVLVPALTPLSRRARLASVHLQDNAGGVEGNHVLVGYVVQSSKYLRELNGLKLDHLMGLMVSHEDKLPNRFENYEALYLAEELDRAKDADLNEDEVDSPSVSRLYSVLSQSLSDIDLSWCHLTEFPEAILTLTSLQVLDISHNLLERIPVMKICAITSLTELQCSGNYNLAHPPAEISDQGGTAVMFYLKETIHSGIPDDEVALIALGAESVGKSSCLSCLITGVGRSVGPSTVKVNQSWQDSKDREFEDGTPIFRGEPLFDHALLDTLHERLEKDACPLNINDRDDSYLTLPEGTIVSNMVYWRAADDLQFNVVDLPGHSFYSAINRLFFRRRAVYLLVWRVTDFDSDEAMAREMIPVCNEVCAAMDFLQAVFPGANCLAVATHIDVTDTLKVAKQSQIVCKAIRRKLEEMKTQCEGGMSGLRVFNDGYSTFLSCKSGDGIPNLRKDLISFTRGLEVFKSQFPKSFLQLRNALRLVQKRLSLLKFSLYKALAKICGVHGKAFDVATKMLHERKYLNYYDDEYVLRRLHTAKLKLKTLIRLHLTMGGNLKKVQQKTFTRNSQAEGDDGIVIINPHWLVGVFRGLLVPDIELLIDWFSGVLNQKHFNPRLLQSTLNYITKGILERKLVYFLWPGSNKLVHKQFWAAYADRGIGPLKVHEGNLVSQDDEYDFLLDILAEHKIISKMTAESFWVPCMQMAVHARAGTSVMTDARVFKPIKQGISSEIRFNYLPPDFFPVLMATCAGVKDHWSNAGIDQLDYSPVAAAVYLKGDKAQISISRAPRANYYTVTLSASTLNLAHDIIDRLHMVEHVYPGMVRFSKTVEDNDPMVKPEEVPNILFLYSLHAVPHTEILIQEVRKYDLRCKVTSAQASQYSKILASLSIAGRDMIRSRHVNTMSKLRAYTTSWSTSTHGVLSRDKLTKHGFNESDTRLIYSPLVTEAFYGQVVILCLDNLYQDDAECDWHPVVKHVQGGAHLIVILLPGCQKVESLPVKPVSIIDLRFADWIQEGRELRLPYEARVALKNRLEPLTQRLMKNWRGNPEVVEHFDPPPISCNECLLGGQLLRQRFDVPEHVNLHHRFLMEQLKTGDFSQDEAPIFCINGHANQLETVLSETTRLSVTACPACIEQGKSLPYCFSRQSCVEVLHGKRHLESHDTPAPAPASEAPASEVHASEAQAVAAAKSAVAGPMLRCPHCKSEQLDLVDILQAEVFVSYSKKKIKCTSCGKGKIIHADDHVHANEHGKQQTQKKSPVRLRSPRHDERLARTGSAAFAHAGSASSAAFAHAGPASSRPTLTHLPQSWPTLTHSPLAFTPSAESHDISKGNYGSAVPLLCQECKTEFDLDAIDPLIACVQGAVGHLEEHLDILAVKPSTLYQIKEVTPTVGLLKAARNATVFVAFMDSHYVKSSTCMAEFSEAVMAGRTIIPVLLPGYSGGANWYPPDTKYKRGDGVNMIAPFTVLKNFLPINVDYDDEGSGEDSKLATALLKGVCVGLYGGVSHSQRTRQKYAEFRKRRILLCTNLLGVWAKLEPEEIDRKIARLWRRHAGSLDQIPQVKQQLASFGIKTSGPEIEIALAEISVTLKTMGAAEFRQFMWNLISNVMIKAEQSEDAKI